MVCHVVQLAEFRAKKLTPSIAVAIGSQCALIDSLCRLTFACSMLPYSMALIALQSGYNALRYPSRTE